MQETHVWPLGAEDLLEKEMSAHSSILAWVIPWTEEPGKLQLMGLQKSWTQLSNETTIKLNICFLKYLFLFIYLAVLGLSCGMQDLVPWPGIEPGPPVLGLWSLRHWTTREIPEPRCFDGLYLPSPCLPTSLSCKVFPIQGSAHCIQNQSVSPLSNLAIWLIGFKLCSSCIINSQLP